MGYECTLGTPRRHHENKLPAMFILISPVPILWPVDSQRSVECDIRIMITQRHASLDRDFRHLTASQVTWIAPLNNGYARGF